MPDNDTFLLTLIKSLKSVAKFDAEAELPPVAILWPDGEREWEALLPRLRQYLPILTLGPYNAATRSGPVVYVRCMMARALADKFAPNVIPIIYLPGIHANQIIEVDQRSAGLNPLVELRYRSTLWITDDGQDWTVADFFQKPGHGLGVAVRDDDFTQKAMRRVLPVLCDLTLAKLHEEAPWKVKDFEALVASIDSLIGLGESESLEFKSTARWDVKEHKKNTVMEDIIVKTVAGFLNSSRGGALLIGVEDNRQVCGIELDYPTFSKETDRNPDAYERWLMTLLLNNFGPEFAAALHPTFYPVNDRMVCKLTIDPAPAPAFVREKKDGKDDDILYLRTGNATNRLTLRAALNYYKTRWG